MLLAFTSEVKPDLRTCSVLVSQRNDKKARNLSLCVNCSQDFGTRLQARESLYYNVKSERDFSIQKHSRPFQNALIGLAHNGAATATLPAAGPAFVVPQNHSSWCSNVKCKYFQTR
jgi:hypothetical protein